MPFSVSRKPLSKQESTKRFIYVRVPCWFGMQPHISLSLVQTISIIDSLSFLLSLKHFMLRENLVLDIHTWNDTRDDQTFPFRLSEIRNWHFFPLPQHSFPTISASPANREMLRDGLTSTLKNTGPVPARPARPPPRGQSATPLIPAVLCACPINIATLVPSPL